MTVVQALTQERQDEILKIIEDRSARRQPVTVRHLSADAHISTVTATALLRGWLRVGVLRKAENYTDRRPAYVIVPPDQRPNSLRRTAEQNMWDAMKGLPAFSPLDLSARATTAEIEVTEAQARTYCQSLLTAGYLDVVRKGTKTRQPEYRQMRRTGAMAPLERRVRAMSDPNTGVFHVIGVHK